MPRLASPEETLTFPEQTDDSVLEERALERLAELPEITELLEPLRQAHEPTYCHSFRVGEAMAEFTKRVLPKSIPEEGHLADAAKDITTTAFICGVLHDIGKRVGTLPVILDKVGPLSSFESALLQRHVPFGVDILKTALGGLPKMHRLSVPLSDAVKAAEFHHTPYNELVRLHGYGAVEGMALLTQLADQFDARTDYRRPYIRASYRENPGVSFTAETQIIQPGPLMAAILQDGRYAENVCIFAVPIEQAAAMVYHARFGTDQAVERPLP